MTRYSRPLAALALCFVAGCQSPDPQPAGEASTQPPSASHYDVEIIRSSFGVPHITAGRSHLQYRSLIAHRTR